MKKIFASLLILSLIAISVACMQANVKTTPGQGQWSGKMLELSQVLSSLYPYVWSREEFYSEKNFTQIETKVKHLADLAHNVNTKSLAESPDADPAIQFLARDFDADISRAYDAFRTGSKEYSRQLLGSATNHCISCHSRNQVGPQFDSLSLSFDFEKLNPFVRAEAYMATRQFKKAADEFLYISTRKDLIEKYPFEIEKALKRGLSIHIRVFNDVDGAQNLVQNFLKIKDLPLFLEKQAQLWKVDLQSWKNEGKTTFWRQSNYIKKIDILLGDADHRGERGDFDSSFINYMRASAIGHLYLSKYKGDPSAADIMFKLGIIYESLEDLGYWTLSDNYFSRCIREKPHSPIAVRCLYRYEQNVYLGYTGSGGTNLPADVRAQLRELRELAL